MVNSERLVQWQTAFVEWLNEQDWFLKLKAKWEELDPQSRTYLKTAGVIGTVLIVFILTLSSVWRGYSLRSELSEKNELLNMIQSSNEELRHLREINNAAPAGSGPSSNGDSQWNGYFESITGTAGLDKTSLGVSSEKPGNSTDTVKESLFDLNLKHVSIKQVVRYAFYLENGSRPVKLRNLRIDTNSDPAGYMDATLAVSAFAMVPTK